MRSILGRLEKTIQKMDKINDILFVQENIHLYF